MTKCNSKCQCSIIIVYNRIEYTDKINTILNLGNLNNSYNYLELFHKVASAKSTFLAMIFLIKKNYI